MRVGERGAEVATRDVGDVEEELDREGMIEAELDAGIGDGGGRRMVADDGKDRVGGQQAAVGRVIKIHGLQFTVIGTFKEKVSSFGQSELDDETIVIPITVQKYFTTVERIDPLYVQARSPELVEPVTDAVSRILAADHRPGAKYKVENLAGILNAAKSISVILSLVLLLVSAIALVISGIGIMNIMLATVTSRIREIGIRKAVGATNREIRFQFLAEAILISLIGGFAGIVIGYAIPYSVRFLTEYRVPITGLSGIIAIIVSSVVGVIFGTVPAARAAQLDPVESLRYE